jgi:hypothetical protein
MILKSHIAIILITIFIGKFLAIDVNGLNIISGKSEIVFVKPICKKWNSAKVLNTTERFSKDDLSSIQIINLAGYCSSQFHFEILTWRLNAPSKITAYHNHILPSLSYRYLDNDSPPPRQV